MQSATGGNARDMKSTNRLLMLRLLCTGGAAARTELAARTGLTKMTASNIIAELLAAGLVEEQHPGHSAGAGRRAGLLALAPGAPAVLGVFVGRRHCSVLAATLGAEVLAQQSAAYPDTLTPALLLDLIAGLYVDVRTQYGGPLLGCGISAVGPLNADTGTLLAPPNFYGIRNLPLRELLAARLGLPCTLIHDASAGALAEQLYGAGRGLDHFLYLHLENGVGAGLVTNGALYDGEMGLAGEIGHMSINFNGPRCACGNRGCLELYANEAALADEVRRLGGQGDDLTFETIVTRAAQGDGIAAAALDQFCDYVSFALVSCLNVVDTHRVFVGYRGSGGDLLEKLLEGKVNARLLAGKSRSVRIERSQFGAAAPVLGAAAAVARQVFDGALPVL